MVSTLQAEHKACTGENRLLHDQVMSLQAQLITWQAESEKHRLASEQHRHEFWVFAKLFDNRKAAIAEEHQVELKALHEKISALETESRIVSKQHLRYCQHNSQLCQLIHSLHIYVGEMETEFSAALQSKTSELVLLQANLSTHKEQLGIIKAGVHRAAAFLAELHART
jgi:hypothetical protein